MERQRNPGVSPLATPEFAECHRARIRAAHWLHPGSKATLQGYADRANAPSTTVTESAVAEERRLLYVAVTRAVDELHCSWAAERMTGAGPQRRQPSPWLASIEAVIAGAEDGGAGGTGPAAGADRWRDHLEASRAEPWLIPPEESRK